MLIVLPIEKVIKQRSIYSLADVC